MHLKISVILFTKFYLRDKENQIIINPLRNVKEYLIRSTFRYHFRLLFQVTFHFQFQS